MWEKLVGTHHKPSYIRLPSRLPVGECFSLWFSGLSLAEIQYQKEKAKALQDMPLWSGRATCVST